MMAKEREREREGVLVNRKFDGATKMKHIRVLSYAVIHGADI